MLNLLTIEEKKSIKREYRMRTLTVVVTALFFTTVFAIAELLPGYFLETVNLRIKNSELEDLSIESERVGDDTVALALARTDTILGFINSNSEETQSKTSGTVASVLKARPAGVSVKMISFDTAESGQVLTITGLSLTRANLLDFSKNLSKQPEFKSVNIPPGDLAQTQNIDFRITVSGDF